MQLVKLGCELLEPSLLSLILSPFFAPILVPPVAFFSFSLWSNHLKLCKMSKTCGRLAINLSSMLNLPPVSPGWWGSQRLDDPLPLSSGGAAIEEIQRIQCRCMTIMAFMAVKCFKILRFCLENKHVWATATNTISCSSNITFNTNAAIQNHLYMSLYLSPWLKNN